MKLTFWKRIKIKDGSTSVISILGTFVAEFVGTSILLFVGCMGSVTYRFAALAFGLGVMITVQCFWHISGAYVNPILTIAGVIVGQLPLLNGVFYLPAQMLGAFTGFGLVKGLLAKMYMLWPQSNYDPYDVCTPHFKRLLSRKNAVSIEFFITFILVWVFCAVWDNRNRNKIDSISLRLGFSVVGLVTAAGPFTKGHLNPARTIAPAIINKYTDQIWTFLLGQFFGGITAAILHSIFFFSGNEEKNLSSEGNDNDNTPPDIPVQSV